MLIPPPRRSGGPTVAATPVVDVDLVGDLAARRRAALLATRDEVRRAPADPTLAGNRARALVCGATVELHGPPDGLVTVLGRAGGRRAWT